MIHDHNIYELPEDLPVPQDDGACNHLYNKDLPEIELTGTNGITYDLSRIKTTVVVFTFPRTGIPGQLPLVDNWNEIPGARGCTPQTCGYRDNYAGFKLSTAQVFGMSSQNPAYQKEMAERLQLPFPILSDERLAFTLAMQLPTFEAAGQTLIKRLAFIAKEGKIVQVFYPVFPPEENARQVLEWLEKSQ